MIPRLRSTPMYAALAAAALSAACSDRIAPPAAPAPGATASFSQGLGNQEVLDHAIVHLTVEQQARIRAAGKPGGGSKNLSYRGGTGGIGV